MQTTIALAGNPNSGKTTLFNQLTGAVQYVGNWPGVTVEKKEGPLLGNKDVRVMDLPGIYSLSPYTPEEVVSREYLLNEKPDVILNIADATNLERNLYLTSQLLETGIPTVLALNMSDLVAKRGDSIDTAALQKQLGCPVVQISALRNSSVDKAVKAALSLAGKRAGARQGLSFSEEAEQAIREAGALIKDSLGDKPPRWYAIKCLEGDGPALETCAGDAAVRDDLAQIRAKMEEFFDDDAESIITGERYDAIADIMRRCVRIKTTGLTPSDRIDQIVTNRFLALPIFVAVMFLVYFVSIMSIGDTVTGWTNDVLFGELIGGSVESWLTGIHAADWVVSLVVDGIIGGVGAVLGFVPQMAILFVLLTLLEDCGYMARVAFIMDRIFRKFGLSGKSFIPMLISSGCAVPGIMATQTIENEKDRRMTIITTSFIPCGAKLPIIALIGGALFGGSWWVSPLIYFIGVGSVIVSGIILKKTRMFAGDPAPFIMELPQYHLPSLKNLLLHVWERVRSFIVRAGTVIFVSSVAIWFLVTFGIEGGGFAMVEDVSNSFLAAVGSGFAVLFQPLGFGSWQAAVGAISGLVAKENLVATLAVVQGVSGDALDAILDDTAPLWAFMQTILPGAAAGLSYLVFNMLCAPCFAAIGAIRRQMANGRWTAFAVAYQTLYAYCVALMVYQFGSLFAGGGFTAGTAAAIVVLGVFLFLLLRPAYGKRAGKKLAAGKGAV